MLLIDGLVRSGVTLCTAICKRSFPAANSSSSTPGAAPPPPTAGHSGRAAPRSPPAPSTATSRRAGAANSSGHRPPKSSRQENTAPGSPSFPNGIRPAPARNFCCAASAAPDESPCGRFPASGRRELNSLFPFRSPRGDRNFFLHRLHFIPP